MESKIAVLGGVDFVMPFSAMGLDTFAVAEDAKQAAETAKEIIEGKYGLIVVAENIAPLTQEVFESVQNKAVPAIVVVPFTTEPSGVATESLGHVLKMATGINILETN